MKVRLALMVALALPLAAPMATAETVVIRNDGGGNINDYRNRRAKLAKAGAVRIEGKCLSACTIYTTLPNACVMPDAKIGFHGTTPKSGLFPVDYWLDMRMGEFFRGEVRAKYEAEWRFLGGSDQFHVISGRALQKLDPQIVLCKGKSSAKKKKAKP